MMLKIYSAIISCGLLAGGVWWVKDNPASSCVTCFDSIKFTVQDDTANGITNGIMSLEMEYIPTSTWANWWEFKGLPPMSDEWRSRVGAVLKECTQKYMRDMYFDDLGSPSLWADFWGYIQNEMKSIGVEILDFPHNFALHTEQGSEGSCFSIEYSGDKVIGFFTQDGIAEDSSPASELEKR